MDKTFKLERKRLWQIQKRLTPSTTNIEELQHLIRPMSNLTNKTLTSHQDDVTYVAICGTSDEHKE